MRNGKPQLEAGWLGPVDRDFRSQLGGQRGYELEAKRARARAVEVVWYAYTVVADGEYDVVVRLRDQIDFNPASSLIWQGILQRVRDQFIHDKSAGNRYADRKAGLHAGERNENESGIGTIGSKQGGDEFLEEISKIDLREVCGFIQPLMDESHGFDPILALSQHIHRS